ncbi:MAG TPA: N-acetyl-gamma-glutamyl-phosphate reductase, partial [Anaerolineales bacterium]|nr:N-acetyl-gamma-glutamyl-phosphate reductase [Anaerolineales bacterium]
MKTTVSILGGSGYGGGELLRLLLAHPCVEVKQVTSRSHLREYVYQVHPNLRKRTQLKFSDPAALEPVDILFLAQPHGQAQHHIEGYTQLSPRVIDLSADFRLRDGATYEKWYGEKHAAPEWLSKFVYGLPELHRIELGKANYVSGVGCNATASTLALLPLVKADLLDTSSPIYIEIKVGSSESGAEGNAGSHHAERAKVIRTFSAFGHRHTAEVIQEMGVHNVSLTMTAVDLVRGALATAHAKVKQGVSSKDLWKAYRAVANENPFLRVVKEQRGIHRVPEPKILAGTNYADLGFELDESNGHVVAMCAI